MTLHHRLPVAFGLALLAAGCAEGPFSEPKDAVVPAPAATAAALPGVAGVVNRAGTPQPPPQAAAVARPRPTLGSRIFRGTGMPAGAGLVGPGAQASGDEVTLSFNAAEIAEVARVILGDTLGLAYAVDASVTGQLTLETSQPVPRSAVLGIFEAALRPQGFAVTAQPGGLYVVLPLPAAQRSGLARPGRGYGTEVVAPRFIGAAALKRLLEPLLPEGQVTQVDAARNLLLVTGTAGERQSVRETVAQFDVDWMRGMSFGLFSLRQVQARRMVEDLREMLGGEGGNLNGLVRLVALERLNAVLAVSAQPAYLEQVQTWVARLDREGDADERRVFVYKVQNGRASDLSRTLSRAFGISGGDTGSRNGVGSGLGAGQGASAFGAGAAMSGGFGSSGQGGTGGQGGGGQSGGGFPALPGQAAAGGGALGGGAGRTDDAAGIFGSVQQGGGQALFGGAAGLTVTADEVNNALVVVGTGRQFELVEAALRRLDLQPVQVLIEAAVTEVTLTHNLRFGLQWALRSGNANALLNQSNNNPLGAVSSPGNGGQISSSVLDLAVPIPTVPGFSFAYSAPNISVVLDALDQITKVNVLSSPQVLVLNNQTAALQVGNQVPVTVGTAQSTLTSSSPIVSQLQYRDTGIILQVTPRVNESGLVLMDIQQEVSSVVDSLTATTSQVQSPTFQQRRLVSTVAVQDGQTIALGGLIRDSTDNSRGGIPVLSSLPWVGPLFGNYSRSLQRTELLVLLTPRVVRNPGEAQQATEELRARFRDLRPLIVTPQGTATRGRAAR